ncbi:sigma-70 family RNA polymerase sigma factor [Planctobacterium marinum]|uniref:Ecf-type RNA polymerase sigma factor n=1 Tax=Planctobacterium marinum TaxID=1631968 RepID=A0AA48KRX7_9ALTE|nr:Ecf-type RNA polymerase sigma factor [Planctobacterium marinum]
MVESLIMLYRVTVNEKEEQLKGMQVAENQWLTLEDNELIKAYISGEFAAFECLYNRHKGGSFRFILRQVKDSTSAEDLMQELWFKVVSNIRQFKGESKFTTWLYQMARNLMIDRFRHLEVVSGVIAETEAREEVASDWRQTADTDLVQKRQKAALSRCLQKLPKAQLESFLLKEEGNLTRSDVAQITGVSLEAAKSRLRAAYNELRTCISRVLGENDD